MLDAVDGLGGVSRGETANHSLVHAGGQVADGVQHRRLRGPAGSETVLLITEDVIRNQVLKKLRANNTLSKLRHRR